MQDAFSQDMFNISDLNNSRYNGHVQACGIKSGTGGGLSVGLAGSLVAGGKKDRKGCTKGKIEAIMRNNAVRTKVVMPLNVSPSLPNAPIKKSVSATSSTITNHHTQQQTPVVFVQNHEVQERHEIIRVKEDHDDPYTFTEPEPQSLSLYQASGSATAITKAKSIVVSSSVSSTAHHHRSTNTLITGDRNRIAERSTGIKFLKSHQQHHIIGSLAAASSIHDQSRTSKLIQTTVQEATTNRSSRALAKRKIASGSGSLKGFAGSGTSSFNNQGQHQDHGSIKSSHYHHHYHRRSQYPDRVCLPAKRQPRKSVWQRERNAKHELLERIHAIQTKYTAYNRDLYPLGVEVSDSETDEFELERRAVYERHWFSRTDPAACLLEDNWNKGRHTRLSPSGADEEESPRERRVEFARAETRRRLAQTLSGLKSAGEPSVELVTAVVRAARVVPNATAVLLSLGEVQAISNSNKMNRGARFLMTGEKCTYSEGCQYQALPATRHCLRHIMYNVDQRLFSHCTGRLEDNTQCNRPTFDPAHVSPLCSLHTTQTQATVVRTPSDSRHSRKKSRILGLSRNSKRNNKKKKKTSSLLSLHDLHHNNNHHHHNHHNSSNHRESSTNQITSSFGGNSNLNYPQQQQEQQPLTEELDTELRRNALGRLQHSIGTETVSASMSVSSTGATSQGNDHSSAAIVQNVGVETIVGPTSESLLDPNMQHRQHPDIVEEVPEEVLAIEALDPVELANQTTRLLEEHDLNNVLNQISTDLAFNDLFTDKNGEYEPTREETEELERALLAVDNDVRSLERMTRSLPLPLLQLPLDGLLDTTAPPGDRPASPAGGSSGSNFDTTSPTAVNSFHNGFAGTPVVSSNVDSSSIVSDTLHQPA